MNRYLWGRITLTTNQDFVLKCCSESTLWSLMEKKQIKVSRRKYKIRLKITKLKSI